MKNILLITSMYPSDDIKVLNNTSVCHYFAKEWVSLGYNVRVIYCYHCYPSFYYPLLKIFSKSLANKAGVGVMFVNSKGIHNYELDGIQISRMPVRKNRPRGSFSKKEINKAITNIETIINGENFTPDIILGHFLHPALDIIASLKIFYPKAKTAVSLHGKVRQYEPQTQINMKTIDLMGYRSYPIKRVFESFYGEHPYFMCPSGVPIEYITQEPRKFENSICNFIYVGAFMKRKFPSTLIPAISSVFGNEDYSITFVGDGNGKEEICKKASMCKASEHVQFTGRLNRDEVKSQLDKADVFIMISRLETFGLVYLEAMARGCIVIASKNEGMEGIIEHGRNGFLCEAGNEKELAYIVAKIKNLNKSEIEAISEAGRQTALCLTDKLVAKKYIETFK